MMMAIAIPAPPPEATAAAGSATGAENNVKLSPATLIKRNYLLSRRLSNPDERCEGGKRGFISSALTHTHAWTTK